MKKRSQGSKPKGFIRPDEGNTLNADNLNGSNGDIRHRIATAAYELYQQRGREDGHDVEDWLKAEAIVQSRPAG